MQDRGLGDSDYTVVRAEPRDVPSYLSAADTGLAFIKPCFSKLASSPTKYAEYLACGLPLIINAGIGDSDVLSTQERVGALVEDFSEIDYSKASAIIEGYLSNPAQMRRRTREVAERLFDVRQVGVRRYACLYEKVLAGTN
jgi:glycosyltransferase involved in cell wall biosynthesis